MRVGQIEMPIRGDTMWTMSVTHRFIVHFQVTISLIVNITVNLIGNYINANQVNSQAMGYKCYSRLIEVKSTIFTIALYYQSIIIIFR